MRFLPVDHSSQSIEWVCIHIRPLYHILQSGKPSCICALPKIQKEGAPFRPIISSINSVTYNISKHLSSILAPLVGNTQHHIKNSQDLTNKVRETTLDPDKTMVSYDVTSLFTCILTQKAVKMVKKCLLHDSILSSWTNFNHYHICDLLDLCLMTTYLAT